MATTKQCPICKQQVEFNRHCAAYVCPTPGCDNNHIGFARCFCGWSVHGGDGRRELIEMGETIEPDEY